MYIIRLRPFLVWIGIALALGLVSGGIALGGLDFYTSLHLPAGSPPAALFPAAWAVFPLLLGVSAYFLWAGDPRQKKHSLFTQQQKMSISPRIKTSVNYMPSLSAIPTKKTTKMRSELINQPSKMQWNSVTMKHRQISTTIQETYLINKTSSLKLSSATMKLQKIHRA